MAKDPLHSSLSIDALLERLANIERQAAGPLREEVARLREDIIVDDWGPYPYIDALVQGRNEPWGTCTLLVSQQRYGGQYAAIVAPDDDWATTVAAEIDEHTLDARELADRLEEAAVLGLGQRPSDALRALDNRLAIRDATHDNPRALVTAYEVILGREP